MPKPLRILALLSDPLLNANGSPVDRLGLEEEIKRVRRQLSLPDRAVELHLQVAIPELILNTLRDRDPFDLLHFSGHGNQGVLAFEDGRGQILAIDPLRLQAIFTPPGRPPCRVACLSACHPNFVRNSGDIKLNS